MGKIKKFKDLCRIVNRYKEQRRTVVFCHGFFDILHCGHIEFLRRAKKLGDYLVVGVDHDDNARILKGPGRPINNHLSRMIVLECLEPVDYVFLIPSIKKYKSGKEIHCFYDHLYLKLKPTIAATCVKAGTHGQFKKKCAELSGAKFVDIKHKYYDLHPSRKINFR